MKELGDEYMHFKNISYIFSLHISEDINEPLKTAMGRADPDEVDFFASHPRVPIGGGTEDKIIEDGSVGGDSDPSSNHHSHFELVPILIATAEWSL